MKRYLNIVLSIVLSLVMLLALGGCGNKKSENGKGNGTSSAQDNSASNAVVGSSALIGNWKGKATAIYDDASEMSYGVEATFKDDGTYIIKINAEEMVRAEVEVEKKHYSNNGYSFDEYILSMGYETFEDYIKARVSKLRPEYLTVEGRYYFDGNEFLMDGIKMEHKFENGVFNYFDEDGSVTLEKV